MKAAEIRKPTKKEKQAYEAITGGKKSYGIYHKCCFHLHTPVSYDYSLIGDWDSDRYKDSSAQDILDKCIERHVVINTITLDDVKVEGDLGCYDDQKQLLSYLLLADSLMASGIEAILISDHNTIQGIDKLKTAIKWVRDVKRYNIFPVVMLGIEISCADRNHVVGMFDDTTENRKAIAEWLHDHLIDIKDGVFVTSIDALEFIKKCGGIGYIAHINTSDILKKDTFSGGFKKRLLDSGLLRFVGLSDISKQEQIAKDLRQYRKAPVNFLLDNDAHDIDSVEHNCFWIKGGKCTYSMVEEALNDYHISVDFALPAHSKQYIKGLYVERSGNGFLTGKDDENFCLTFSNALNCLIGGRGTGKSSILEMLEYVITQRCGDGRKLNFLCAHGTAWVVYELDGEDYLFEISMPKKEYPDSNILNYFGGMRKINGRYEYVYEPAFVSHHAATHYLHIRKIIKIDGEDWKVQSIAHPEKIRDRFLDSKYSINELVNTASGEEINQFIENTILKNRSITDPTQVVAFRKKSGLLKMLDTLEASLKQRAADINAVLQPFNLKMQKELRVSYQQCGSMVLPDFEWLIYGRRVPERALHEFLNIREADIVQYVSQLCSKMGPVAFFRMLLQNDVATAQSSIPIKRYFIKMSVRMIEAGVQSITPEQESALISEIFSSIVAEGNMSIIQSYFKQYLLRNDRFDLLFNVNNREGSNGQAQFMNVRDLSLGQKVVAMLTFVLGYSEYCGDYRPLIIDQPEDNLDNQYIYKNLVKQLREIKEKRQVIIATHNATIVTNAKADLVCEMQSDNVHGWIESMGYPSEWRVKKRILNHLEGGIESFIHKTEIYRNVIS